MTFYKCIRGECKELLFAIFRGEFQSMHINRILTNVTARRFIIIS